MATPIDRLPVEIAPGELETRYIELGDMAIRHAKVPAGTDFTPVLQGLPDDRCPSPHWGIVLEGSISLQHADGTEETAKAGEVYHWPAGHTAYADEAVVFIEVGPVAPMRQFSEHAKQILGRVAPPRRSNVARHAARSARESGTGSDRAMMSMSYRSRGRAVRLAAVVAHVRVELLGEVLRDRDHRDAGGRDAGEAE